MTNGLASLEINFDMQHTVYFYSINILTFKVFQTNHMTPNLFACTIIVSSPSAHPKNTNHNKTTRFTCTWWLPCLAQLQTTIKILSNVTKSWPSSYSCWWTWATWHSDCPHFRFLKIKILVEESCDTLLPTTVHPSISPFYCWVQWN